MTRGRHGQSHMHMHTRTHLYPCKLNYVNHLRSRTAGGFGEQKDRGGTSVGAQESRRGASASLHSLGIPCYTTRLCFVLFPLGTTARSLGSSDSLLVLLPDYKAVIWL